jgi:hypothetical protein
MTPTTIAARDEIAGEWVVEVAMLDGFTTIGRS